MHRRPERDLAAAERHPSAASGVRQAGTMFLVMGVLGISAFAVPGNIGYHRPALLVVIALTLLVGVATRTRLVQCLTGYRSLLIPSLGLSIIGASNALSLLTAVPIGIYFVLIFVWIGQWLPPRAAYRFAPVAAGAYLVPFAFGAPRYPGEVPSVVLVIGASMLVADVLARQAQATRLAQVRSAEAMEALSRASHSDDLTGVGNRRLGTRLLDGLRAGDAVVILDLDHFKAVNDRWGHARGDELLRDFGAFLNSQVRAADSLARMGGEEFLMLLPDAADGRAKDVVQRLISAWNDRKPLATVSAGVAIHQAGHAPAATYAQADAALYEAKTRGRARLIHPRSPSEAESVVALGGRTA